MQNEITLRIRQEITLPDIQDLEQLLIDLEEYFDQKADADGDSEGIYPNKEMQLLTSVRKEFALLNKLQSHEQ